MATEFICTLRASGGDFSTATAWESAVQTDLTSSVVFVFGITTTTALAAAENIEGQTSGATADVIYATDTQMLVWMTSGSFESGEQVLGDVVGDVTTTDTGDSAIAVLECYNDWSTGLSDQLVVGGWNSNSTNYIILRAAAGSGTEGPNFHGMIPGAGFRFRYGGYYLGVLETGSGYMQVIGIEIEQTYSNNTYQPDGVRLNSSNNYFERVILRGGRYPITTQGQKRNPRMINSLVIEPDAAAVYCGNYANFDLFNCVIEGQVLAGTLGSYSTYGSCNCRNVVAFYRAWGTTNPFNGSRWTNSLNNASSAGSTSTPPGTNSITVDIRSDDFEDEPNQDFHLAAGSELIGVGYNYSSLYTTDADGDTWPSSGAWDIGFDYYIALAPTLSAIAATSIGSSSIVPRVTVTF